MAGFFIGEEAVLTLTGELEAAERNVVAAAFDKNSAELFGYDGVEKRNVFLNELFLQIDSVGGDNDALFVLDDALDGRDEVGEGFAHAGAGFDQEAAAL